MKKQKQKTPELANVGALMDTAKPKAAKVVKEREINKIGYVGNHLSTARLKQIRRGMTGEAARVFKEWFKDDLRVRGARRVGSKTA